MLVILCQNIFEGNLDLLARQADESIWLLHARMHSSKKCGFLIGSLSILKLQWNKKKAANSGLTHYSELQLMIQGGSLKTSI